jgi:fatty-acyl-CoA synthase
MAAVELLPDRAFDPGGFARFLSAQDDLGTKWAPAFVRVAAALPQTANGKVTKGPLRRDGWWAGDDPVYRRRPGPDGSPVYLLFDRQDTVDLLDEFSRHGRRGLVGG